MFNFHDDDVCVCVCTLLLATPSSSCSCTEMCDVLLQCVIRCDGSEHRSVFVTNNVHIIPTEQGLLYFCRG